MSDLTATNCGCSNDCHDNHNNCGCNILFLLLILSVFNGNSWGRSGCDDGCGCGFGSGFGLFGGDGNSSCSWLIWILLISCFCGNC